MICYPFIFIALWRHVPIKNIQKKLANLRPFDTIWTVSFVSGLLSALVLGAMEGSPGRCGLGITDEGENHAEESVGAVVGAAGRVQLGVWGHVG